MAKLPAALGSLGLGANASAAHGRAPPAAPLAQREVTVPEGVLPGQQIKLDVGGITVAAVVPPGLLAGQRFRVSLPAAAAAAAAATADRSGPAATAAALAAAEAEDERTGSRLSALSEEARTRRAVGALVGGAAAAGGALGAQLCSMLAHYEVANPSPAP